MSRRSDRRRQSRAAEVWHAQEEWRSATRASELLRVRTDLSERKWRLFALECCREILHLCVEPWHREVLEQTEQILDGPDPGAPCKGISQLTDADNWRRRWSDWLGDWYSRPVRSSPRRPEHEVWAERAILDLGTWREGASTQNWIHENLLAAQAPEGHPERASLTEKWDTQFAGVLREIAGDPFALVRFDPSWRTSTATCLAQMIHESGDFALMPILADAIQDAGCEEEDILHHCRDTTAIHVRGCWVVDLVLGKN